jgi:hypothetical protein
VCVWRSIYSYSRSNHCTYSYGWCHTELEQTARRQALWLFLLTTYFSGNQIRRIIQVGLVARMEDRRAAYRHLVGKCWNRPLGNPTRKMGDNVKMDVKEICWQDVHWIGQVQNTEKCSVVVNKVIFRLYEMREISRITHELVASNEILCIMEFVSYSLG